MELRIAAAEARLMGEVSLTSEGLAVIALQGAMSAIGCIQFFGYSNNILSREVSFCSGILLNTLITNEY